MIAITVKDEGLSALLGRAQQAAANPEAILRSAATTLLSITLGNFSVHGAAYRPKPWPPEALEAAARLGQASTSPTPSPTSSPRRA